MRIWTLHPKYLDAKGIVALWREALLARAVLHGETLGYQHHPQLIRFRVHPSPHTAINTYISSVLTEAQSRGYSFDALKVTPDLTQISIECSEGQLHYEWGHLLNKLKVRDPALFERWREITSPDPHPLFRIVPGPIESWERPQSSVLD